MANDPPEPAAAVYLAPLPDDESVGAALMLARGIRDYGISCVVDGRSCRIGRKLDAANRARAYLAAVVGPSDIAAGTLKVRDMGESTDTVVQLATAAREIAILMLTEPEVRRVETRRALEALGGSGQLPQKPTQS